MRKATLLIITLLLSLQASADNYNLCVIPVPEDMAELESSSFELYHRGSDYWLGTFPETAVATTDAQWLSAYRPGEGDLYLYVPGWNDDRSVVGQYATVVFRHERELIVQAGLEQLAALPPTSGDWTLIPLTARPFGYASGIIRSTDDFSPYVEEMVEQVSESQYDYYIQSLEDFVTRSTFTTNVDEAADWIRAQFYSFGLTAYYDEFLVGGNTKYNVVGELTGMVHPDSVFLVVAHYDATAGAQFSPEPLAPGANDNASGTASVIECARILSRYRFEKTIRFVAFCGEEQGLLGSYAYTSHLLTSGVDVAGAFNLDMISYSGGAQPPWNFAVRVDNNPNSATMGNKVVEAANTFLPTTLNPSLSVTPNSASSDHWPFWANGWAATFTLQSYSYPYYHTVNDLNMYQDAGYGTAITKASLAALADLSVPTGGGTDVSGSVSGTWAYAGNPYRVVGDTWIEDGGALTIEPGVFVLFDGPYQFEVRTGANLNAVGTEDHPILFTAFEPDGIWSGLRMLEASSNTRLEFCHFSKGLAEGTGTDAYGGAIYLSGSSPSIVNCVISNCEADAGGAIYCDNLSSPTIEFCTFSNNTAQDGGGVYAQDSDPEIVNCIIWGNTPNQIATAGTPEPEVRYSDIQDGWSGDGNIDLDPLFGDAEVGEYHLKSDVGRYFFGNWVHDDGEYSPCIDAGDPASSYAGEIEPNGDRVNIGAYGNSLQASKSFNDPHYSYGEIAGHWTADNNPMYLVGDVTIPAGETLEIDPGLDILAEGYYEFMVEEGATLIACGTEAAPISFSAIDDVEGWQGISLDQSSDETILEHVQLSDALLITSTANRFSGGGIYVNQCSPTLRHCTFTHCEADQGGALYLDFAEAQIIQCEISDCHSSAGGAIFINESEAVITGNVIHDNTATNGAGISAWFSDCTIENNLIFGNTAVGQGGGIYNFNSASDLINNTISNNSANQGDGIFFIGMVASSVRNTILWGNNNDQITLGGGPEPEVMYCDIEGGWAGEGNIDDDPDFVTGALSDFHLRPDSPCIDTGDPDAAYNDPEDWSNAGYAQWPAQGTVRNDMGIYGGAEAWNWVGVEDERTVTIPTQFTLEQNYPNPFNPTTTIGYALPHRALVQIKIYNIAGQSVATLVDGINEAGRHEVSFDARLLTSGIYLVRMEAGDFSQSCKMLLLK